MLSVCIYAHFFFFFLMLTECRLCFALCMWNENDPILKERLFGLTGPEGNHGEDVKEECDTTTRNDCISHDADTFILHRHRPTHT